MTISGVANYDSFKIMIYAGVLMFCFVYLPFFLSRSRVCQQKHL